MACSTHRRRSPTRRPTRPGLYGRSLPLAAGSLGAVMGTARPSNGSDDEVADLLASYATSDALGDTDIRSARYSRGAARLLSASSDEIDVWSAGLEASLNIPLLASRRSNRAPQLEPACAGADTANPANNSSTSSRHEGGCWHQWMWWRGPSATTDQTVTAVVNCSCPCEASIEASTHQGVGPPGSSWLRRPQRSRFIVPLTDERDRSTFPVSRNDHTRRIPSTALFVGFPGTLRTAGETATPATQFAPGSDSCHLRMIMVPPKIMPGRRGRIRFMGAERT